MRDVTLSVAVRHEVALIGRFSSDERLASLVSRGNARAFELIYERHWPALHRYCRSILRDEEDAKDALQNAMTSALAALQVRERDIAVRPWLFRIVHNEAISLLRRRRPAGGPIDEHTPSYANVEHLAEENERLATLVADLQSLGERHRAALVMRELCGLTIREIATTLSTSPGAAKQALFEARCALHELVEGRAMECATVRRMVSERDGRILRGRKVRAHLRACANCEEFRDLIVTRTADMRLLVPPLPAFATAAWLVGGGAGGGAGAGGAATGGALAGGQTLIPLAAKVITGVALFAAATSGVGPLRFAHHAHAPAAAAAAHAVLAHGTGAQSGQARAYGPASAGARSHGHRRDADQLAPGSHAPAAAPVAAPDPLPATGGSPSTKPSHDGGAAAAGTGHGTPPGTTPQPPTADPPASSPSPGSEDLPPGLAKRDELPPGLAKRDQPPPGLAKRSDPPPGQSGAAGADPAPAGQAGNGNGPAGAPGQQSHGKS